MAVMIMREIKLGRPCFSVSADNRGWQGNYSSFNVLFYFVSVQLQVSRATFTSRLLGSSLPGT